MSYNSDETSVHSGKPRELYKFEGTYGDYHYTPGQDDITYQARVYQSIAAKRTNVKIGTQEDDGVDLAIEMPVGLQLVRDYAFRISPPKLHLTVYRFHTLDDVKVYWSGPVTSITVQAGKATVRSPSALAYALSGDCPSVYYQTPCNRVLFDAGCKVSRALNTVATVVSSVNGRNVAIADDGGKPDGFFLAGELVAASGERRMIVGHAGPALVLNYPFARLAAGAAVEVVAGCDHSYSGPGGCPKFNNQQNFGGFPFIPTVNPFAEGIA